MDYGFTHAGRVFTPNGSTVEPGENDARNTAIQAAELAAWSAKPADFLGYVVRGEFQTWLGQKLGTVEVRSTWRRWTRWQGRVQMDSIVVRGTNGGLYHGRYCSDNGQACRVRLYREGSR